MGEDLPAAARTSDAALTVSLSQSILRMIQEDSSRASSQSNRLTSTLPPDSLPGYTLIRELHRGGQGVVYEATQHSTRRTVAVKVLLGGDHAGERAKWRFEREVNLAAALRHNNIVVIHDSGITQGGYYYAMDYVRGEPLDAHVRRARPPIRDLVRFFLQVCDAVAYAHRHGVIHRDLKPSNILVGEDGKPKVLDFGLAKMTGDDGPENERSLATLSGQLMGTLRYMSPEQTLGKPALVDVRTDVYALGVIMYELATERPPYLTGDDLTVALKNIRETDPPKPSRLRREVNSELESIILKAMHKETERRYQSAGELAEDLRCWLDGRPVTAKSDSAFYVLRKLAARHYFHTSVIAALLLAILGFGLISYHFWGQTQDALTEQAKSEASARAAYKDMSGFFSRAQDALRRQAFGWFLLEWQAGRRERAEQIRADVRADMPEHAAMTFLLDGRMTEAQLRQALPKESGSLLHLAFGERLLAKGRTEEACREFELSCQSPGQGSDDYRRAAGARLRQLRGAPTAPASSPVKEGGVK